MAKKTPKQLEGRGNEDKHIKSKSVVYVVVEGREVEETDLKKKIIQD